MSLHVPLQPRTHLGAFLVFILDGISGGVPEWRDPVAVTATFCTNYDAEISLQVQKRVGDAVKATGWIS